MFKAPATDLKDFYKTDHRPQYVPGTQYVYSNLTPRGSRNPKIKEVVVFGLQYFVKNFLVDYWNEEFFNKPADEVVAKYKRRLDTSLGPDAVAMDHIYALHKLGYLPLRIKALPEGTLCKMRVPLLTIRNTHPDFFWLTNDLETLLSLSTWQAITSATIAFEFKKLLSDYANKTSDIPEFVQWQAHDFSMRGMGGLDAAMVSGAGHLISFTGTDTIPAIDFLEYFYKANSDNELIGGSVTATEHSVMCMGGKESERETYERLMKIYPTGILSVVSDTWDYWKILTETLPSLKDQIMQRGEKEGIFSRLVIRPDSGDPVKIVCGDPDATDGTPAFVGSMQLLWNLFGGTVNSKGYKQLDPHIGLIYGDGITLERAERILSILESQGFASTNIVFGVGSYTYQCNTRDTFGMAVKATFGIINEEDTPLFKDPATDDGLKKSAQGMVYVNAAGELVDNATQEEEHGGLLETIFHNGIVKKEYSLQEIRDRLESQRSKGSYIS